MRILTYKRTHTGDPDCSGQFGINDCMGRVRNWSFDAVIGVGGIGSEPKSYGIDGRVTWVGRNPSWTPHPQGHGQIVTFKSFALLEETGPLLSSLAPYLARRMYEKGARILLKGYSKEEQAEAEALLNALLSTDSSLAITGPTPHSCHSTKKQKLAIERSIGSKCKSC
ncbi:hypothetical protein [Pseudomonas laurylsulfatiphila]|uniref:hypothetical protein n=1 Tax=Pseudomonas laurylsulfatiphila TaxID=2011015 RepID=UPI003D0B284B